MPSVTVNGALIARAHEVLSGATLTASVGLTASNYDSAVTTNDPFSRIRRAEEVLITIESADVRWTCDGTTPTVTAGTGVGHIAGDGDAILLSGYEQITKFRVINAVASNGARLQATFLYR
jgi:hypothetical protein